MVGAGTIYTDRESLVGGDMVVCARACVRVCVCVFIFFYFSYFFFFFFGGGGVVGVAHKLDY